MERVFLELDVGALCDLLFVADVVFLMILDIIICMDWLFIDLICLFIKNGEGDAGPV